jgi:hypothetical protein
MRKFQKNAAFMKLVPGVTAAKVNGEAWALNLPHDGDTGHTHHLITGNRAHIIPGAPKTPGPDAYRA